VTALLLTETLHHLIKTVAPKLAELDRDNPEADGSVIRKG
jgi:hypothetical protein